MKCLICKEVQGNKVGIITCSGRSVCMKCLPEVIDSFIYLREWSKGMKKKYKED